MENEREYLLKSVKTEQTASYDLGLIGGAYFLCWRDGLPFSLITFIYHQTKKRRPY